MTPQLGMPVFESQHQDIAVATTSLKCCCERYPRTRGKASFRDFTSDDRLHPVIRVGQLVLRSHAPQSNLSITWFCWRFFGLISSVFLTSKVPSEQTSFGRVQSRKPNSFESAFLTLINPASKFLKLHLGKYLRPFCTLGEGWCSSILVVLSAGHMSQSPEQLF